MAARTEKFGGTTVTTTKQPSWSEIKNTPRAQELLKEKGNVRDAYNAYNAEASSTATTPLQSSSSSDSSQLKAASTKALNAAKASQGSKREWLTKVAKSVDDQAGTVGDVFANLDRYSTNFAKQLSKSSASFQTGIQQNTDRITSLLDGATKGVSDFEARATGQINEWAGGLKKALEPVGLCSAIGDLTDLAKNPLGAPQFLANSATSILNKISPGFVSEMDAAYKTLKMENLSHLPSKMMGSIRSLTTALDEILSVPFEIMSDIYNGLMEILDAIADLIDAVVATVMNLAMAVVKALIDAIIPVDELLEFFSAIGELASFVGGIAGAVGGFNAVTNIAGQVGSFASSASGLISNPLAAIPGVSEGIGQVTGAVGQVTNALRNPEQFLPPEIGQQMQRISQIPGLGFVGNLGYSVGDTLDSLSEGVFTKALDKFADKLPIINEAFGKSAEEKAVDTQETNSDEFEPPKSGPHQTAQGIPQVSNTSKLLNSSVTAYGITEDAFGNISGIVNTSRGPADLTAPYGFSL